MPPSSCNRLGGITNRLSLVIGAINYYLVRLESMVNEESK